MRTKSWFLILAMAAPSLAVSQTPESELLDGKFSFRVGGQAFTHYSTTLRVDSARLGRGTQIEFERHTGLEENVSIARLDGGYRFTDRHSMALSYYDIDRTGSRTINLDIKWAEEIFPDGIKVESRFRERILKLSYAYTFLIRPKGVMAASAGLHTMRFDAGLQALDLSRTERSTTADAPLPVFGIRGQYRFAEKWRFVGQMEWFDVKTGDFDGTFSDALLTVEHDTWDRFGFGFGINSFGLNVSSADEDLKGILDIEFDSFVVYFKGNFDFN